MNYIPFPLHPERGYASFFPDKQFSDDDMICCFKSVPYGMASCKALEGAFLVDLLTHVLPELCSSRWMCITNSRKLGTRVDYVCMCVSHGQIEDHKCSLYKRLPVDFYRKGKQWNKAKRHRVHPFSIVFSISSSEFSPLRALLLVNTYMWRFTGRESFLRN